MCYKRPYSVTSFRSSPIRNPGEAVEEVNWVVQADPDGGAMTDQNQAVKPGEDQAVIRQHVVIIQNHRCTHHLTDWESSTSFTQISYQTNFSCFADKQVCSGGMIS